MGELLDALHRLQAIELQVAKIRDGEAGRARRVSIHKRRVKLVDEKVDSAEAQVRERQRRIDALTLDVAARDETISKHRDALSKAKTNKEYAAVLAAINTEKADNAKIEREILELMEEVQRLIDARDNTINERAEHAARVADAEGALREYELKHKPDCARLQMERDECAKDLPASAVAAFRRVAERHGGAALVPIVRTHPKREEYACGGCNMKVTLEAINALRSRDDIRYCNVCGRILYLEASEKQSTGR
ncbi:MAG: zinc ribbon domain-containing protein [Phycisphaerae bacterium]